MQSLARQNPARMGPPGALARRMRIAFLIGMLVMDAMCGDPENRSPFERERATPGEGVFDPLVCLVAAMGEQSVIAHANAEHSRGNVKNQRGENSSPIDEEKCRES